MKVILKPIFEWLIDGYVLFDNQLYNYMAIAIVGLIAYVVAWNIVGGLYRNDMIGGRTSGSIIHWIIRLITFIVLFTFVSVFFQMVRFIITVPLWSWAVLFCVIIVGISIYLVVQKKLREDRSKC